MERDINITLRFKLSIRETNLNEMVYGLKELRDGLMLQISEQMLKSYDNMISEQLSHAEVYPSYLEKFSERLFTKIELWLKTGVIAIKTTSLLERVFREIGRRLKRIAWGWSDTTATNLSKMILIKQYSRDKWISYWKEGLGIKGNFLWPYHFCPNTAMSQLLNGTKKFGSFVKKIEGRSKVNKKINNRGKTKRHWIWTASGIVSLRTKQYRRSTLGMIRPACMLY